MVFYFDTSQVYQLIQFGDDVKAPSSVLQSVPDRSVESWFAIALETVVQFATGLWSWYSGPQAYNRYSRPLKQVHGTAPDIYCNFIGPALPRASTAWSDDAGIDCLLVLCVHLSCFMVGRTGVIHLERVDPAGSTSFRAGAQFAPIQRSLPQHNIAVLFQGNAVMREEVVDINL
jgi:hypothetical protein